MNPNELAKFREQKMTVLNHKQAYCAGCRRMRSAAQFEKESSVCKQCVLRGLGK